MSHDPNGGTNIWATLRLRREMNKWEGYGTACNLETISRALAQGEEWWALWSPEHREEKEKRTRKTFLTTYSLFRTNIVCFLKLTSLMVSICWVNLNGRLMTEGGGFFCLLISSGSSTLSLGNTRVNVACSLFRRLLCRASNTTQFDVIAFWQLWRHCLWPIMTSCLCTEFDFYGTFAPFEAHS